MVLCMSRFANSLLCIITFHVLFLLQGCVALLLPMELALETAKYEKDVSEDPKRGFLVGKQYKLIKDLYLYQYLNGKKLYISSYLVKVSYHGEDPKVNPKMYSVLKNVPKGTVLKISNIILKSSYLEGESCVQCIIANYDDQEGKNVTVDISDLFKGTFQSPDTDWVFTPKADLILEIESTSQMDPVIDPS